MKNLFTLSLVVLSLLMKAQSWCAPGATWHYPIGGGGGTGYYKINYNRDTVINNQIHNVLAFRKEMIRGMSMNPFVQTGILCTHKSNNVVYLGTDTLFSLDFSSGTKWRMAIASTSRCPTTLTALDTGRIIIQGQNLKFLRVSTSKSGYFGIDTIVDKIGFLNSFVFEGNSWCYDECFLVIGGPLRCYSDNGFSYNRNNVACNYYYSTGLNQQNLNPAFSLYPNPANHSCFVSLPNVESNLNISITSLTGALVKEITIENTTSQTHEINLEGLEKGIYFIRLKSNHGTYAPQKLVVNSGS